MHPTDGALLGNSGVRVSRLGLGMATLGDVSRTSDSVAKAVIVRSQELGLRHIDTAAEYGLGLAERRLGSAVADGVQVAVISTKVGRLVRPATRRYRISHGLAEAASSRAGARMLATRIARVGRRVFGSVSLKAGPTADASGSSTARTVLPDLGSVPSAVCDYSYDGAMRSFEESVVRLGTDRIDVGFIHEPDLHQREAARGAYRALESLKAGGRLKAIGVAINDPDALVRFADSGDYDCFLLGGRYTLLEQQALDRLLPLALSRGISIILGGPFNSGIMADPGVGARYDHAPADGKRLAKALRIKAVCERHGVSTKAAALQFPLGHPAIVSVLVGAASVDEIEECTMLVSEPLASDLWDELRHERLIAADAPTP